MSFVVRHRIDGLEKIQRQLYSGLKVRHRIDGLETFATTSAWLS